jgi:hypothetical protein
MQASIYLTNRLSNNSKAQPNAPINIDALNGFSKKEFTTQIIQPQQGWRLLV